MGYVEEANNAAVGVLAEYTWVSLHTTDPGEQGYGEVSNTAGLAASGGYSRQETAWGAAADGAITGAPVTIPVPAGNTVTHWGLWSAQDGGVFVGGWRLVDDNDNWYSHTFDTDGSYQMTPQLVAGNTVVIPGPSGRLSVGQVTAAPWGSTPVVSNSGTTTDAVLDFTLIAGPQGDPGIQGEKGETGADSTVPGPAGKTLSGVTWNASKHLIGNYTDNTSADFGVDPVTSRTIAQGGINDLPSKAQSWDAGLASFAVAQTSGTTGINRDTWTQVGLDGGGVYTIPGAGWWRIFGWVVISESSTNQMVGARVQHNTDIIWESHNLTGSTTDARFPSIVHTTEFFRRFAAGDTLRLQAYHNQSVGGQGTYVGFYGRSTLQGVRLAP